jgi:hypothetical protein
MKTKNGILLIICLPSLIVLLSECNQIKITNEQAEDLVKKELILPVSPIIALTGNELETSEKGQFLKFLEKEGFINVIRDLAKGQEIQVTEKGKPYYQGDGLLPDSTHVFIFKTIDIDFDRINNIVINQKLQTVKIEFYLKATNINPVVRLLNSDTDNPKKGELLFKKGKYEWYLLTPHGSNSELVFSIMGSNKN